MKLLTTSRLLLILITTIVITGCVAPAIYKPVVMPPKVKGMADVNTIAITSVKGNSGWHYNGRDSFVRGKISSFLSGVSAPGKSGFEVVDSDTLKSVIKQQELSEDATFDSTTSIRLGKLVGADALMNATYQISNVSDQTFKNKYTDFETCVEFEKDGKKCKKHKERTEYCTKRNISVELIPSVVSVTTGALIYVNDYSSHLSSSKCPSQGNTLRSPDSMVVEGFSNIFEQMRKDVYFYEIVLKLKMIESDDSAMPKQTKSTLKGAMELVEQGMVERACGQIAKAAASYNQSPAIMYNMGICKEVEGENEFAKAFFERALDYSSLLSSSDRELVYSALRRMEGTEKLVDHKNDKSNFFNQFR